MATQAAAAKRGLTKAVATVANAALVKLANNFSIELAPFPDGEAALAFKQEAAAITVVHDAATHRQALEALRRGKALKRALDDHWRKVLRWLEDRKKDVRAIMDTDLELVDPGIEHLTSVTLRFESAEKERERLAAEQQRLENERKARADRERELAALERLALNAEATSQDLSDRERAFAQRVFSSIGRSDDPQWLNDAAKSCGFKQENYGVLLMGREKITYAIEAMRSAAAIREQAAAVAEKPVEVVKTEVQSNLAKVAGTRTVVTWTGECIDKDALIDAVLAGTAPRSVLMPSQVGINDLARSMHENLDRIPGLRHVKKETKAA